MREIGKNIEESKMRVEKLLGIPLLLKVNSGRGRSALFHGTIINVFPAVFTVKLDSGESKTFSYADVQTRGVLFLKNEIPN
ncbi:MAG: Veg family protein [Clostridia bacterium]